MGKTIRKALQPVRVANVCDALEALAPLRLAQSWDNVGLLAGDRDATVRRVLLCIDLTPTVVDEAIDKRAELVMAYHPPLFKPISRLTVPRDDTSSLVFRCIKAGIAIYSTHTALDAADGGTNDCIAQLCGIRKTEPLEYAERSDGGTCKIVTFVPAADADRVADAMFEAGAGRIGDYERCSFRIPGTGTFFGTEATNPVVGRAEHDETGDEIRLEAVAPRAQVPAIVDAMRRTHPYEEPPVDIYALHAVPERGIGRQGILPKETTLGSLARVLKNLTAAECPQVVGEPDQTVRRAVICVGSAGSLPFKVGVADGDVIVTGEIRHHDALTIRRTGACAIALGHWTSERPVLEPFGHSLSSQLPKLEVMISEADREPFAPAR